MVFSQLRPPGSFEISDIMGKPLLSWFPWHCASLAVLTFLTTASWSLLLVSFCFFSWLSALPFYMCFLSGLFYSCVLLTQFSNFGLPPKHQFYNAMFHLHLTHNIWNRTEHLKPTLLSDLFLWRAPPFANEPKLETPGPSFFFLPLSRTHNGQHQVLLDHFTQSLLHLSNFNGNQLGAGPPSFSCYSISIC